MPTPNKRNINKISLIYTQQQKHAHRFRRIMPTTRTAVSVAKTMFYDFKDFFEKIYNFTLHCNYTWKYILKSFIPIPTYNQRNCQNNKRISWKFYESWPGVYSWKYFLASRVYVLSTKNRRNNIYFHDI